MSILVYQSLFNIGSGKMELSISVTYVGLVHFQGSTRNEMLTRNEILLNPILTSISETSWAGSATLEIRFKISDKSQTPCTL